jgi:hypothetical protein
MKPRTGTTWHHPQANGPTVTQTVDQLLRGADFSNRCYDVLSLDAELFHGPAHPLSGLSL